MAEFSMVMKQAARLCSAQKQCAGCPLCAADHALCELRKNVMRKFSEHEARRVDNIVMDWAAKHPEPRYPTWREWLRLEMDEAIPADIAEKLGIKPIGGVSDEKT